MGVASDEANPPHVEATIRADGSGEVAIGDQSYTVTADGVDSALQKVVAHIAVEAVKVGMPLRAVVRDPDGERSIQVDAGGRVTPTAMQDPQHGVPPSDGGEEMVNAPESRPSHEATAPVGQHGAGPESELSPDGQTRISGPNGASAADEQQPIDEQSDVQAPPRQSFLRQQNTEELASQGWRGLLTRVGIPIKPGESERVYRRNVAAVSGHWPAPRTIAIVNAKGGAGKTPATVLLAAVFARCGGAGVLAWDNNQTRGTLGWRTEQGPHEDTLLDLLPDVERLLGPSAQAADLARHMHHQPGDRFDVLRGKPVALATEQRIAPKDVDAIYSVASKYYRLIFIDSGNDESDPMWLRMIDHTDQLVVATTTRDDHAEAGALLLSALTERDRRSARLADNAVAVISQADPSARAADVQRIVSGYNSLVRATATIPFDAAMVDGILSYGSLRPATQRAWLAAAASVAAGL